MAPHQAPPGSSPLSRGILFGCVGENLGPRIIPALAGNTIYTPLSVFVTADHPRSRGEYSAEAYPKASEFGSSPLSRGIRRLGQVPHRHGRIIPALAGNTACRCPSAPICGDHPRSRGEYGAWARYHTGTDGSSPLSRGIPDLPSARQNCIRIIPALAGNTSVVRPAGGVEPDHPRSRGEYWVLRCGSAVARGSSPLSRGIQVASQYLEAGRRIIPALAGNTIRPNSRRTSSKDHPRSRGEYGILHRDRPADPGSSPLSRGIPSSTSTRPTHRGIIPALAGNTRTCGQYEYYHQDHPRSRGEYWPQAAKPVHALGSSPLSRGIPSVRIGMPNTPGIIPALAGNTSCR